MSELHETNSESGRKLASVQRILALDPIEGADAIERASVLGWHVVVKKGDFQVGDLAVYLEIDSVPPDIEVFQFLWRFADQRPNNYRIRTIKLRSQISQGILFPWHAIYPVVRDNTDYWADNGDAVIGAEGTNITEALGVRKYDPPLPVGSTDIAGQFFDGVSKTDEERVQSNPRAYLGALFNRPYYITVKADGASMTCAMHEGEFKVASRNFRLKPNPDSAYYRAAEPLRRLVEAVPNLAVQGELVGPGIQKNPLGLNEHRCLVFNVYDRYTDTHWSFDMIEEAALELGFHTVELVETGDAFNYDQDDLLAMAEGYYTGTKNRREGIVIRSNDSGPRVSFKAISNTYLLKATD
jgi:RNA ligase (TIGR02306 family)